MKAENLFLLAIVTFTAGFMTVGVSHGARASFAPWVIGAFILVLAAVAGFRNSRDETTERLSWGDVALHARRHAPIAGTALFAYGMILVAGFVAMAVTAPWLYIALQSRRWLLGLMVGLLLGGIVFLLEYFLAIPVPETLLSRWMEAV